MDRLSATGPAVKQTSGKPQDEWEEASRAIPPTRHFAEPGSVEHSNSKPRLLEGPAGQVACITDAEKSLVFQTLQWKGKD